MNSLLKSLFFAGIASLMYSCGSDADDVVILESEICLKSSVSAPLSRVSSLDCQSVQLVSGRQVGVVIEGGDSEHVNVPWLSQSDGTLQNGGNSIYWSDSPISVYGYHPYDASWACSDAQETFSVSQDQSQEDGYLSSDLLWAKSVSSQSASPVHLTFKHMLSKVNVTLVGDAVGSMSDYSIHICNTRPSVSFNPISGILGNATGTAIDICAVVGSSKTASSIIVPQTCLKDSPFIKVQHAGTVYYYTLPSDKTFESGCSYSYTLSIDKKLSDISLVSENISSWTDERLEGVASETSVPQSFLIWSESEDASTLDLSNPVATRSSLSGLSGTYTAPGGKYLWIVTPQTLTSFTMGGFPCPYETFGSTEKNGVTYNLYRMRILPDSGIKMILTFS